MKTQENKHTNWGIISTYIGTAVLLVSLAFFKADYYGTLVQWEYSLYIAYPIAFAFEILRFAILYTSVLDFQKGKVQSALSGVLFGVLFSLYDMIEAYQIGTQVHHTGFAVPLVFLSLSVLFAELRILLHVDNGDFITWLQRKSAKNSLSPLREERTPNSVRLEERTLEMVHPEKGTPRTVHLEGSTPILLKESVLNDCTLDESTADTGTLSVRILSLRAKGKTVKEVMEELGIGSKATYYKYANALN